MNKTYVYRKCPVGKVELYEVGECDVPRSSTTDWCDRRICEGFWGQEALAQSIVTALNAANTTPTHFADDATLQHIATLEAEIARLKESRECDFEIYHAARMKLVAAWMDEYGGAEGMLDELIDKYTALREQNAKLRDAAIAFKHVRDFANNFSNLNESEHYAEIRCAELYGIADALNDEALSLKEPT